MDCSYSIMSRLIDKIFSIIDTFDKKAFYNQTWNKNFEVIINYINKEKLFSIKLINKINNNVLVNCKLNHNTLEIISLNAPNNIWFYNLINGYSKNLKKPLYKIIIENKTFTKYPLNEIDLYKPLYSNEYV